MYQNKLAEQYFGSTGNDHRSKVGTATEFIELIKAYLAELTVKNEITHGATGDNIVIEARIIGVADVIETMATHRPYRPALNIEKALLELIQKKGILYDVNVVDACVRLLSDKGFKFD